MNIHSGQNISILASFIAKYQGLLIIELRGRYFAATGEAAKTQESLLAQIQSSGQKAKN